MRVTQKERCPAFGNTSIALSWFMRDVSDHQVWFHDGGTTGFKTCSSFCEDPAVAVVVFCNTGSDRNDDGRNFYRMGETLMRQLIEASK